MTDFTDAQERAATVSWFKNPASQVSAHFLGDAEGGLTPMVSLEYAAWHDTARNRYSVGIELTQPTMETPYTEGHYQAAALAFRMTNQWLRARGMPAIPARRVLSAAESGCIGHEDTTAYKSDPGRLWEWERFISVTA